MKKSKNKSIGVILVLLVGLFLGMTQSAAGSDLEDDWQFGAEIYLWGAGISGQSGTGSNLDIDFDDILGDLKMAFMGAFAARKGKWAVMTDFIYLDMEDDETISGTNISVELSSWIITPSVGYTVLESDRGSLNVLLGARYLYLKTDLGVGGAQYSESGDNWDGIVGITGQVMLNEKWYLPYYLDIGTGDSDMTWQGNIGIGYRFSKCDVIVSYRYLDWDFDDGKAIDNMNISGPMIGLKFLF